MPTLMDVPVDLIDMNGPELDPEQRELHLSVMIRSMKQNGFLVGPFGQNRIDVVLFTDTHRNEVRYHLTHGRIRYLAAIEVGLTKVPCRVLTANEAKQWKIDQARWYEEE